MSRMNSSPSLRSTMGDRSPRAVSPSVGRRVESGRLNTSDCAETGMAVARHKAMTDREERQRRVIAGRTTDFTVLSYLLPGTSYCPANFL